MIGIYDSGIGGLGIFNAVRQVLPRESMLYYGDTKHFPFGEKSSDQIRTLTLADVRHIEKTCQMIVIACNTASVNDLDYYRAHSKVPIIGVVPVIKTAAQLTHTNVIALLATAVTVQAPYTDRLIQQFAPGKTIKKIACTGLADTIEHGDTTDEQLQPYLKEIAGADIVVLGCTHYTLIKGRIQRLVGPDVKVLDSNEAVARQTLRVIQKNNLVQVNNQPHYIFECSGNRAHFLEQVKKYVHL